MSKPLIEINTPFKALLATLNSLLETLNALDYKLYDDDNPDYYIGKVFYDGNEDRLKFTCKEEDE